MCSYSFLDAQLQLHVSVSDDAMRLWARGAIASVHSHVCCSPPDAIGSIGLHACSDHVQWLVMHQAQHAQNLVKLGLHSHAKAACMHSQVSVMSGYCALHSACAAVHSAS